MSRPTPILRHYRLGLLSRGAVFLTLLIYALALPRQFEADLAAGPLNFSPLTILWGLLMLAMARRLFPSRHESLGCQKIFARRFLPTGRAPERESIRRADRGALWIALAWAAFNGLFFLSHGLGWIEERFLVCLAGFYGLCDMICILFFCPFQVLFLHNRCCVTCRIFNWDYLMICTPLFAIPGWYAGLACGLALIVFLRWEAGYLLHRPRFFEESNGALRCQDCRERLCQGRRVRRGAAPAPRSLS